MLLRAFRAVRGLWARARAEISAPQLLVLSFALLTGVGWAGFWLLPGLTVGEPLNAVDALFMSTSAVCVTGLSVVDVSSRLTFWGQAWLLLLIQAGGLGILTFAGLIATLVGGRTRLAVEEATGGPASVLPAGSPAHLVRATVAVTLALELVGAIALWLLWHQRFGALHAAWLATFHAVSAFCNAGFSLFRDSLVGFREHTALLLVVAGLIVVGGIGFPVIQDLRLRLAGRHARLTTHTRVVLATTALLLVLSTAAYGVLESKATLAPLGPTERVANALFMSVTARTAGFNTVDYDALSNEGLFLTVGLMWVGGAPASVAGGIKVTTVALLGLLLWSRLRGDRHVSVSGRTIPPETIQRATGLAVGGLLFLALCVFLLLAVEPDLPRPDAERLQLVRVVFEVQSALSTVGLSMGLTENLSSAGRLLLVPVMLFGRIGPLAVVGAMVLRQRRRVAFRYTHEDVIVG